MNKTIIIYLSDKERRIWIGTLKMIREVIPEDINVRLFIDMLVDTPESENYRLILSNGEFVSVLSIFHKFYSSGYYLKRGWIGLSKAADNLLSDFKCGVSCYGGWMGSFGDYSWKSQILKIIDGIKRG